MQHTSHTKSDGRLTIVGSAHDTKRRYLEANWVARDGAASFLGQSEAATLKGTPKTDSWPLWGSSIAGGDTAPKHTFATIEKWMAQGTRHKKCTQLRRTAEDSHQSPARLIYIVHDPGSPKLRLVSGREALGTQHPVTAGGGVVPNYLLRRNISLLQNDIE